jgi:triosephosphate isomerase
MIIANWKMNGSKEEVKNWIDNFNDHVEYENQSGCIFCPPSCFLDNANEIISSNNIQLNLGSQDLDPDADNPSTGGISGKMLKDLGCDYVLIGHSERRMYFNEHEDVLLQKLTSAALNNLKIVYCVGETKEQREQGMAIEAIKIQLRALKGLPVNLISVAYEPIWSIGKGITPSLDSIHEMHQIIKDELKSILNTEENILVSYGGSVSAENAVSISLLNSVDGLLIGGASLNPESFSKVVNNITIQD